jgi:hypothetical protein
MEQLTVTVDYLLEVIAEQSPPPHERGRESMLATVSFVEDRLRAVQVDLVKLEHPPSSRALQARMTRCHILILYIMGDCQSYETKFGDTSLQMALSSYLASSLLRDARTITDDRTDEILSYAILYSLRQDLLGASYESGNLHIDSLLHTASCLAGSRRLIAAGFRLCSRPETLLSTFPSMYQWTMRLVSLVLLGYWHVALKHLAFTEAAQADRRAPCTPVQFLTLARCLLSPCLQHMRFEALKAYNASLGRGEAVSFTHVAQMVQISPSVTRDATAVATTGHDASETCDGAAYPRDDVPPVGSEESVGDVTPCTSERFRYYDGQRALRFCRDVGLPVDDANRFVIFKVVSSSSLRVDPGSRNVRDDEDALVGLALRRDVDDGLDASKVDESGIRVPAPEWFRCHTRDIIVDEAAVL